MNYSCESFTSFCDRMTIANEKKLLLEGAFNSISNRARKIPDKGIHYSKRKKDKPEENYRNKPSHWENSNAKMELDFWDSFYFLKERAPRVEEISCPSTNDINNANPLLTSLRNFYSELHKVADKANQLLGCGETFIVTNEDKYFLEGDSRSIHLWGYCSGIDVTTFGTFVNERKNPGLFKKINESASWFSNKQEELFNKYFKKYDKECWVCELKDNTDVSPFIEGYRFFYEYNIEMKLYR